MVSHGVSTGAVQGDGRISDRPQQMIYEMIETAFHDLIWIWSFGMGLFRHNEGTGWK